MKSSIVLLIVVSVLFVNTSCKKETAVPQKNAPKADAGIDIRLEIPKNSTTLSGKASDTDGNIEIVEWKKIAGPPSHTFSGMTSTYDHNPNLARMEEGESEFELTVTDNDGLINKDTVKVTVFSNLQKLVIKRDDFHEQSNDMFGIAIPSEVYNNLKWVFCNYEQLCEQADNGPQPGVDYWMDGGSYYERLSSNILSCHFTHYTVDLKEMILYY